MSQDTLSNLYFAIYILAGLPIAYFGLIGLIRRGKIHTDTDGDYFAAGFVFVVCTMFWPIVVVLSTVWCLGLFLDRMASKG